MQFRNKLCSIKGCGAIALYQAGKFAFCKKHKEFATRIAKKSLAHFDATRSSEIEHARKDLDYQILDPSKKYTRRKV